MKRLSLGLLCLLLFVAPAVAQIGPGGGGSVTQSGMVILQGGVSQGVATAINCDGTSVLCSVISSTAQVSSTGGGGGAPTNASYWTRVAEAGLSNETALGLLATGLILNTTSTGVPVIYTGTSCTNQFPRSLNASGAATCSTVALGSDVSGTLPCSSQPPLTGDVTTSSCAATLANIPSAVPAAGSILFTAIAAPSTPAAGKDAVFVDSTDKRLHDKNEAGTIGTTVVADAGSSNNFLTAISAAGVISKAQPDFSNLSGSAACGQLPALTGNVTSSGCATTIAANVVTNAMLVNVSTATFKGRTTAGTGSPEDLTQAQATALLNLFTSSLQGLVPGSGGGTTNFLRADGNWAAPSGGGNVTAGTLSNNVLPKATGATSIADSSITDNGTTVSTGEQLTLTANTNQIVLGTTSTTTITMAALGASRTFTLPDANSNPVRPLTCGAGDFVSAIASTGVLTCSTPAGSGTVTTTGSPASGNLTKFSGATSITNGDLSGDVTTSGTLTTTLANIPTATPAAGSILHTNIAAPGTPAAGKDSVYTDSTDKRLHDKNDAGTIGTTVVADTGASNNFLTAISSAGVISKAQPAFSNLSGSATCAQLPALTGDVTTSAGSCGTTLGNIPSGTTMAGSLLATAIAAPSTPASGKGSIYVDSTSKNLSVKDDAGVVKHGVQTLASVASKWINAINDAGLPTATQPAFTDISGTALISQGGTSQTTAAAARASSGLNVDSATGHGDSDFNPIAATDRVVYTNAAFTAARTWTLPAANGVNAGQTLCVLDTQGTVTATNTLTISRAGSDTINGGTTFVLKNARDGVCLFSDGSSKWTIPNLAVNTFNTGSSASSTTFWRGDQTWATPAGGSGCTPGGSTGDVQYNNGSGGCAASSTLNYSSGSDRLTAPGISITKDFALTGDISPTQLTADQQDWAPTNFATNTVIRVDADQSFRTIGGIASGSDGLVKYLVNVTANAAVRLSNQDTGSTAANRLALGNRDVVLLPDMVLPIIYDSTSSRWRVMGAGLQLQIPSAAWGFYHRFDQTGNGTLSTPMETLWIYNLSGSGTSITLTAGEVGHPGFNRLSSGTTAIGKTGVYWNTNLNILLGGSWLWVWEGELRLTQLSTSAQRFFIRAGMMDKTSAASGEGTNGVFFRYKDDVNSGQWVLVARDNGSETTSNSSSAPAANTWYRLKIVVRPSGTAEFFVDDVSIGTVTGIPTTAGRTVGSAMEMEKTVGTTAVTWDADYTEVVGWAPKRRTN